MPTSLNSGWGGFVELGMWIPCKESFSQVSSWHKMRIVNSRDRFVFKALELLLCVV